MSLEEAERQLAEAEILEAMFPEEGCFSIDSVVREAMQVTLSLPCIIYWISYKYRKYHRNGSMPRV